MSNHRFVAVIVLLVAACASLVSIAQMTLTLFRPRTWLFFWILAALGACSSAPQITRTQEVPESADTPYKNILVITLLSKFDSRRYLEDEVVSKLSTLGTTAVASTSMMDTKTPMIRDTFMEMVESVDADAVLVTQLVSLQSVGTMVDMNPQRTLNLRPTAYWNVFTADVTEYVEPQAVDFEHSLVLLTELYSVLTKETVWGIESKSKFELGFDQAKDYSVIINEAEAIAEYLSGDGLIAQ